MKRLLFTVVFVLIVNSVEGAIGISLTPNTWPIGVIGTSVTKTTDANYFTLTNTGTEFVGVSIKAGSSVPSSMNPGTSSGPDTYVLKFGTSGQWTTITSSGVNMLPWIIDGSSYQFSLQFQAPTSVSSHEQQTVVVTISAYADSPTAMENRTLPAGAPWYGSVIVWIPQFTPEWGGTTGGFWMDKYECSQPNASATTGVPDVADAADPGTIPAVSKQGVIPWDNITFQNSKKACQNRGSGFHLCNGKEWAAAAEYAKEVIGTQPGGNNADQTPPTDQDNDTSGTQYGTIDPTQGNRDLTGTGPVAWSLDQTGKGPYDLNGNCSEWVDGFFIQQTSGNALIYDVTKVANSGKGTGGTNQFTITQCDDRTDPATIPTNNWGTSGYYLLDSANTFIQITGNNGGVVSLASSPAVGTYAYGIYKDTGTSISGVGDGRINSLRNSDSDLKYYAIPASASGVPSPTYGNDFWWKDPTANRPAIRGLTYWDSNMAGVFGLYLNGSVNDTGVVPGFRACK